MRLGGHCGGFVTVAPVFLSHQQSGSASPIGRGRGGAKLFGLPFRFAQRGKSGLWMSEVFPELGKQADELCVINSMQTDLPNHSQAFLQMHTGSFQFLQPSVGAWTLYGLGTENANLPGFVTVNPPSDNGGARNYSGRDASRPRGHVALRQGRDRRADLRQAICDRLHRVIRR